MNFSSMLLNVLRVAVASAAGYCVFVACLAIPFVQNQATYLNKLTMTWSKDINIPEQWGFLRNQVTPFFLRTADGESLHAWHILPLVLYRSYEEELLAEPSGLVSDVSSRLSFRLLRDDPEALLVIYLHGAAGTLGSGYRPPSYRALYAAAPDKIHTVAIDYRGFGQSSGVPSEQGLLIDALTLADWAMNVAGVPPSRIVIFAQSLGTAVATSLTRHLAVESPPILFAGMVFVAPLVDVETLTATYKLGGTVPLLSPVAYFPKLLALLNRLIKSKWPSKDNLAAFIRAHDSTKEVSSKYHITIIHAQDDFIIPWSHSEQLFWHAVNASIPAGISFDDLETHKATQRQELCAGGWTVNWETKSGVIRQMITKHGMHDITMSYPVVSLAVMRTFQQARTS